MDRALEDDEHLSPLFPRQKKKKEEVRFRVMGEEVKVRKDVVAQMEDGLFRRDREGKLKGKIGKDGTICIDRDPQVFVAYLSHLASNRASQNLLLSPKSQQLDLPLEVKQDLQYEIKFWQESNFHKNTLNNRPRPRLPAQLKPSHYEKLATILSSIPEIGEDKPTLSLEVWMTLKPLTVDQIIRNSQEVTELDEYGHDVKNELFDNCIAAGQFCKGSRRLQGIGRILFDDTGIQEGMFVDDELTGFGRAIYPGGIYYIGSFIKGRKTGHGKCVYQDGDVEDGVWQDDDYLGPDGDEDGE